MTCWADVKRAECGMQNFGRQTDFSIGWLLTGGDARQRRAAVDASATPEERVAMYAAKQQRAKQLRKKEVTQKSWHPTPQIPEETSLQTPIH